MPGTEPRICIGVIVGARGLRGEVRIRPFTTTPEAITAYGPVSDEAGQRRFAITILGQGGRGEVIARLSGIEHRDAAKALKGVRLYVPRAALPAPQEEEFYHADLIGLAVERADGNRAGRVAAVHDHGAGAYLEIDEGNGRPLIVPFTRKTVPLVDLAGGRLVIEPPEEIEAQPEENGA